uniref:Uncharacterized protein n=1 Tax=viral metagenome TaxID=1070528 RepID=A0A6M3IQL7_9ZZZZ
MKTLWTIAVIVMIGFAYLGGFASHAALNPPEVIEKPYPVVEYRTVNVTQYVDRWHETEIITVTNTVNNTIVKEVEVEKVRIVNNEWREFESLAEFTAWAEPKLVYLFPTGGDPDTADCDDYAERIQLLAYQDGYLLSAQPVDADGKVFGIKVSDEQGSHDLNRVNIGNDIYIFEPQPDKVRIIKVGERD